MDLLCHLFLLSACTNVNLVLIIKVYKKENWNRDRRSHSHFKSDITVKISLASFANGCIQLAERP